MKRLITLDKKLIAADSFRGRFKEGLLRCGNEAKAYHACVTVHHL